MPSSVRLPEGTAVMIPSATRQVIQFSPRYGNLGKIDWFEVEPGLFQAVYTGGIIINVTYSVPTPRGVEFQDYEFATDNLVMWVRGINAPNVATGVVVDPSAPQDRKISVELFMNGNVVIRSQDTSVGSGPFQRVTRTMRADQIYYDVDNNRAIALEADLELAFDGLPETVHMTGKELQRLGRTEWRALQAGAFSSKLPSDPAVRLLSSEMKYVERDGPPRNIFGIPYRTLVGTPEMTERLVTARNTRLTVMGVPIFYTPYYRGEITEPLGPLQGVGFGNDAIFGAQLFTSWDAYKLLALRPPPGHSWRIHADVLGDRGIGFGTDYNYSAPNFFGYGGPMKGELRHYGLNDGGIDQVGDRGPEPPNPRYRFRSRWTHMQEIYAEREPETLLPTGWSVNLQRQFAWVSDKNFLEQYFFIEYITGPNAESFANVTASNGSFYSSLLFQGGQHRDWISETRWLPKADAAIVGKSLFDRFVYDARASVGYAEVLPSTAWPVAVLETEQNINTGRANITQELSAPIDLGPVRFTPYGVLDLAGYTNDLTGESTGRIYGGGGARAATTMSKVYADVSSELFNVQGINHKVTYAADYFIAESSVPFNQLPMLDRLNDDQVDQVYRSMHPYFPRYVPGPNGVALQTSPVFDPQRYAIRRRVDNRVDTLDDLHILQLSVDQRAQTKRGFPGLEHTVDWMVLNLSASLFPNAARDNFDKDWAFLEYDFLWNIGDRTAFQSSGWFDPFDPGTRYYNVGTFFSRPDRSLFYLGYRQIDPLRSKAIIGNLYFPLTPKYAVTASTSYDFGIGQAISNSLTLMRVGTDFTMTLGFSYNAIVNNFGVQFAVLPNALAATGRPLTGPQFGGR